MRMLCSFRSADIAVWDACSGTVIVDIGRLSARCGDLRFLWGSLVAVALLSRRGMVGREVLRRRLGVGQHHVYGMASRLAESTVARTPSAPLQTPPFVVMAAFMEKAGYDRESVIYLNACGTVACLAPRRVILAISASSEIVPKLPNCCPKDSCQL